MGLLDQIRAAHQAHEALRSSPPDRTNLAEKADLHRRVKEVLDELWEAVDQPGIAASAAEIRRAIRLLTVDADFYAGLNDSEGFCDAAEVWGQYELLDRTFVGAG